MGRRGRGGEDKVAGGWGWVGDVVAWGAVVENEGHQALGGKGGTGGGWGAWSGSGCGLLGGNCTSGEIRPGEDIMQIVMRKEVGQ